MNICRLEPLSKKITRTQSGNRPRVLQVFLNADMRGSHNFLIEVASKRGIDLLSLKMGEAVVFINRKKTLMKVFVYGNTFSYTRRDRIDLNALKHIPSAFGANGEFEYDRALKTTLIEKLKRKEELN
jgi:hypothetical protein